MAHDEGIPVVGADSRNELYIVYPNGEVYYHAAWVASLISAGIWSGDQPHRFGSGRVGQWSWRMAQGDHDDPSSTGSEEQQESPNAQDTPPRRRPGDNQRPGGEP